jgi:hypothetical protein
MEDSKLNKSMLEEEAISKTKNLSVGFPKDIDKLTNQLINRMVHATNSKCLL